MLPDLLRVAVAQFACGDVEGSSGILRVVEHALTHGDDYLVDAVRVSFVENAGTGPGETREFIASWPPALRAELREQRAHIRR